MSVQAISWVFTLQVGNSTDKLVLFALSNYADEKGYCWPSQETLSKAAECGERTVRRSLARLEKNGLIRRQKRRRNDGSWLSDAFFLQMFGPSGSTNSSGAPKKPSSGSAERPADKMAGGQSDGGSNGDNTPPARMTDGQSDQRPESAVTSGHSGRQTVNRTVTIKERTKVLSKKRGVNSGRGRGSRIADDWTLPDDWRRWAVHELGADVRTIDWEADKFHDYWLGVSGTRGVKCSWQTTWRNWMRKAMERGGKPPKSRSSSGYRYGKSDYLTYLMPDGNYFTTTEPVDYPGWELAFGTLSEQEAML